MKSSLGFQVLDIADECPAPLKLNILVYYLPVLKYLFDSNCSKFPPQVAVHFSACFRREWVADTKSGWLHRCFAAAKI
jgi:hypothetical protein